jgi:hypothetical protein
MGLKHTIAGLSVALCAAAQGETLSIVQRFFDVNWNDYGVTTGLGYGQDVVGPWIFTATVDTTSVNEYPWPDTGAAYATTVTLTQLSLGLEAMPILNLNYLFVYPFTIGFSSSVYGSSPWTATRPTNASFDFSAFPLHAGDVFGPKDEMFSEFGPQWDGFMLANGAFIYGIGNAQESILTVTSAVPEPSAVALMVLGTLVLRRCTRTRAASQCNCLPA